MHVYRVVGILKIYLFLMIVIHGFTSCQGQNHRSQVINGLVWEIPPKRIRPIGTV
jgi:hypothetical protein